MHHFMAWIQTVFPWLWGRPRAPGESWSWPVSEAPKLWRPEPKVSSRSSLAVPAEWMHVGHLGWVPGGQRERETGKDRTCPPPWPWVWGDSGNTSGAFVSGAVGADVEGIAGSPGEAWDPAGPSFPLTLPPVSWQLTSLFPLSAGPGVPLHSLKTNSISRGREREVFTQQVHTEPLQYVGL